MHLRHIKTKILQSQRVNRRPRRLKNFYAYYPPVSVVIDHDAVGNLLGFKDIPICQVHINCVGLMIDPFFLSWDLALR